jgi:hydrogenase maturation protease
VVVIGYGNELRGDDKVGVEVARAIATWELPEVQALAVHQLTPELAAVLAGAEQAIFVDACHGECDAEPTLQPVEPLAEAPIDAHVGDPHALLTLTQILYGRSPRAWQVLIPAASFAYGATLSPLSSRGMLTALRFLRDLFRSLR